MHHRVERISEALREELSELIGYEMSDPRVASVAVTDVHISPDKRHAHVRIGIPEGGDSVQALMALDHAKNFLRSELGKRLEMYRIPDLHFQADALAESGPRLEHLLKRIKKGRPRDAEPAPDAPAAEKKAVE